MPTPTWPANPDHQWLYEEGSGSVAAAAAGGKTGEVQDDDDTWRADGIAGSHSVRGGTLNFVRFSTASGNFFGIGANWSGAALVKIANDTDTEVHILSSDRTTHPTTAGDNDGWSWSLLDRKQYLRIETHKTGGFSGFSGSRGYLQGDNNIPRQEWVLVVFSAGPDGGQMINYSSSGKDKETWAFPFIVNNWGGGTGHFTHILRNGSPINTWSDGGARIDAASFYHRYVAEGEWDTLAASLGLYASETYDATPNVTEIARTRTITFDVDTTDVADETDLYYTLDGTVTSDDVVGGSLSGTFEINSDTGQFEIEIEADATIGRTIIAEIRTASIGGTVVDTAPTVTIVADDFNFVPDVTDADEGDTVTYTLTTAGIPDGDLAYWGFVGGDVTAGDLVDFGPDAAIEINNNTATVEFELREDITTEGAEEMIVGIYTDAGKTNLVETAVTVTIADTSNLEGYEFTGVTTRNGIPITEDGQGLIEAGGGSSSAIGILITVDPGFPPGDGQVSYVIVGDASESDFSVSENAGIFTSASGYTEAPAGFTVLADALTEGQESFYIECYISGDLVYTTPTFYIADTSQAAPTYDATPDVTTVPEGGSVSVTTNCTTVPVGTVLFWRVVGDSSFVAVDLASGTLTGSFVVDTGDIFNSSGSFLLTLSSDMRTEGDESFVVEICTGSVDGPGVDTTVPITVSDTSLNQPEYQIIPSATTVPEGGSITVDVITNWVVQNNLYYTLVGIIDGADISTGLADSIALAETSYPEKTGQVTITAAFDASLEGAEYFVFQLRTGSTGGPIVKTSAVIYIDDEAYLVAVNTRIVVEGSTAVFTITALNANPSISLDWEIIGTVSSDDFTDPAMSGTVMLSGGTATVTKTLVVDSTSDGAEYFFLRITRQGESSPILRSSPSVLVRDAFIDFDAWLASQARRIVLVEMEHSGGWVYFGNFPYLSYPDDTSPNRAYDYLLSDMINVESRLDSSLTVGSIRILHTGKYQDWIDYDWRGYTVRILMGEPDWHLDDFRVVALCVNGGLDTVERGRMGWSTYDRKAIFHSPLQTTLLPDGNPVPISIGKPFNVPPVLIDQPAHRYQVHESTIDSVDPLDNGAAVSSTDTLGSGYFELSANPAGEVSADVVTNIDTPALAIIWVCDRYSVDVDAVTVSALPSYDIGLWFDGQATGAELLDRVCQSIGAYWIINLLGAVEVYQLTDPAVVPDFRLNAGGVVLGGLRKVREDYPVKNLTLKYRRNWSVASRANIAGSVITSDPDFAEELSTEWRKVSKSVSSDPLAVDLVRETYLTDSTDAGIEAERTKALRSVRRAYWEVTCYASFANAKEGKTVEITNPRHGFQGGRNCLIVAVNRRLTRNRVILEVMVPELTST